jgi:hypothetical protein
MWGLPGLKDLGGSSDRKWNIPLQCKTDPLGLSFSHTSIPDGIWARRHSYSDYLDTVGSYSYLDSQAPDGRKTRLVLSNSGAESLLAPDGVLRKEPTAAGTTAGTGAGELSQPDHHKMSSPTSHRGGNGDKAASRCGFFQPPAIRSIGCAEDALTPQVMQWNMPVSSMCCARCI